MMELPTHIFRAYDVRGVYGSDLTPDIMARIGGAVSNYRKAVYAVGADFRFSSPILKPALMAGLTGAGSGVVDIGYVPIGVAMYSTMHLGYGMAYVTASHLPPEWNGVKLSGPGAQLMYSGDIYAIRDIFLRGVEWSGIGGTGDYERRDVVPEYIRFVEKTTGSRGGLKILLDCGNGAASLFVARLLRDLGHEVYTVNCDIDPRFPGRGSEPSPNTLGLTARLTRELGVDFGVAFDGDGDRTVFIDEKGRVLSAEQAAIIMLKGNGVGDVVANVECSRILERYVGEHGGRVTRVPVGRTYMVLEMRKGGYVLGVESSGHYVAYGNANMDDGVMTLLFFAEAVEKLGRPLSSHVVPMPLRKKLKLEVGDEEKFLLVEMLKEFFRARYGRVDTIDGVRVDFERGWILVRASNTEPVVRVTIEAEDEEELSRLERIVREAVSRVLSGMERKK